MLKQEKGEVLDKSLHYITDITILKYDEDKKILITNIPRTGNSTPIFFDEDNQIFHISVINLDHIYFFKVAFLQINSVNEKPCYIFRVKDVRKMSNNRKEPRRNVNLQGVSTDQANLCIIQVLDLSSSGIKIETDSLIEAEFVDIFFEESGQKFTKRGRVMWGRQSPNSNFYLFGVEFQ
jgi:hypothetical protein